MSNRREWLLDQVSRLSTEDLRLQTLEEIKDHLTSLSEDEIAAVLPLLPVPVLFDCLNNSNKEQIELTCDILATCMAGLSLAENYNATLERALNHPLPCVKNLILTDILRKIDDEEYINHISKRPSLLRVVVKSIECEDLLVAKNAFTIITKVGSVITGLKRLLIGEVFAAFQEAVAVENVVCLRVYDVFVDIAKRSEEHLKLLQGTGILERMVATLDSSDILLKLATIDLLSQLNGSPHGYRFLESKGVISKILSQLDDDEDSFSALTEPSIVKFFGNMARCEPSMTVAKYPAIVSRLFSNVRSNNLVSMAVSMDTLGYIAETCEGKYALERRGDEMLEIIASVKGRVVNLPTDTQIRALSFLENVLKSADSTGQVSCVTRKWYTEGLGSNGIEWIFNYVKNPFAEIRSVALGVILAIAKQHWGQEVIKSTPGLVEFLLDRRIETSKECKEIKYAIVKELSQEGSLFAIAMQSRLEDFVRKGPFYVQVETEVAIEGDE